MWKSSFIRLSTWDRPCFCLLSAVPCATIKTSGGCLHVPWRGRGHKWPRAAACSGFSESYPGMLFPFVLGLQGFLSFMPAQWCTLKDSFCILLNILHRFLLVGHLGYFVYNAAKNGSFILVFFCVLVFWVVFLFLFFRIYKWKHFVLLSGCPQSVPSRGNVVWEKQCGLWNQTDLGLTLPLASCVTRQPLHLSASKFSLLKIEIIIIPTIVPRRKKGNQTLVFFSATPFISHLPPPATQQNSSSQRKDACIWI